jgi:hypothetical protein
MTLLCSLVLILAFSSNTTFAKNLENEDLEPQTISEIQEFSKKALSDSSTKDKIINEIKKTGGEERAKNIQKLNQKEYLKLSKKDKKLYQLSNILVSKEVKINQAKNSNLVRRSEPRNGDNYGCWTTEGWVTYKNIWGQVGVKFTVSAYSCAEQTYMTSGRILNSRGEVYFPGWGYYGEVNNSYQYITNSQFVGFRQGVFKSCMSTNWSCVQELRPWVELHTTPFNAVDYFYGA